MKKERYGDAELTAGPRGAGRASGPLWAATMRVQTVQDCAVAHCKCHSPCALGTQAVLGALPHAHSGWHRTHVTHSPSVLDWRGKKKRSLLGTRGEPPTSWWLWVRSARRHVWGAGPLWEPATGAGGQRGASVLPLRKGRNGLADWWGQLLSTRGSVRLSKVVQATGDSCLQMPACPICGMKCHCVHWQR